jgi:DNA-binding PadR family transcriptional regulator
MVVKGADVTEEKAEEIYQRELKRVSRKFTHMRYHSFLMYFGVLKRLGWVETTNETEVSSIQDNYDKAPSRIYYRLTQKGKEVNEELWSNPLFTLYPDISPNHIKKSD